MDTAEPDPNELARIQQQNRVEQRKRELEEMAGEPLQWNLPDGTPNPENSLYQYFLDLDTAPATTHYYQLINAGIELPDPKTLNDTDLHAKLWEVINWLGNKRVFLSSTDHLSDRELYTHLVTESLLEPTLDMTLSEDAQEGIDILGGCSEEDLEIKMRYYDDEEERNFIRKHYPDIVIPPHEDPPYDRDRHLPRARM